MSNALNIYRECDVRNKGTCMRFHSLLKKIGYTHHGCLAGIHQLPVHPHVDDRMAIIHYIHASCKDPEETSWASTQSLLARGVAMPSLSLPTQGESGG
jgi:hypothetical protein